MVVEVDEQFPVGVELLLKPGTIIGTQALEDLLRGDALSLTHNPKCYRPWEPSPTLMRVGI